METLALDLAGARWRFLLDGFARIPELRARYASFLVRDDGGGTPVRLAATHRVPPDIDDFRVSFEGDLARFRRADIACAEGPDGGFAGACEDEPFSFDMLLRGLVNLDGARRGLLLLHALAVHRGGRAFVHPGLEGAGKSTLARRRLAEGFGILSDELVVVDPAARAACATPFMGECALPRPRPFLPVERFAILDGWGEDAERPLTPVAALRRLAPLVVNYGPGTPLSERLFTLAADLVDALPCRALRFTRTGHESE